MLNHITIMGRLTRDPEIRYTQSQVPVASFTVAVDRDFGGRDGAEKQTDFIDCTAWRSTAEFIGKYFTKGRMIVVSGRLQSRKWETKEGEKRTSWEVVADNVYFGDSRRDGDSGFSQSGYTNSYGSNNGSYGNQGGNNSNPGYGRNSAPAGNGGFSDLSDDDGELPF